MTPEQLKLAEIDARWALEAEAHRQRLIDTVVGSPNFHNWRTLYVTLGVVAIIFGTDYFIDDQTLRRVCFLALAGLLWAGSALIETRRNTRRLDALTELMDLKNRRYADRDHKHL